MKPDLLVIVGPTAVGKTKLTIEVAKRLDGEVVSADSMQVYRHMDIGTAKPTVAERQGIPHHLIDAVEPREDFSVAQYQKMAHSVIRDVVEKGKVPILSGGTGLYIRAVVDEFLFDDPGRDIELRGRLQRQAEKEGKESLHAQLQQVDPETAARLHPNDVRRVIRALEVYYTTGTPISRQQEKTKETGGRYNAIQVGLTRNRRHLYDRINARVDQMISAGLIDEVQSLLAMGVDMGMTAMQGIGYRQIAQYLQGEIDLEEAIRLIKRDTRRYAKRQLTWFRRDKRITWLNLDTLGEDRAVEVIINLFYGRCQQPGRNGESCEE